MKKLYRFLCCLAIAVPLSVLSSCVSTNSTPNWDKMKEDLPPDLSAAEYCDYKIAKCKLPDGKVADVYVFENILDQAVWLNIQKSALQESSRKEYEKELVRAEEELTRDTHESTIIPTLQESFIAFDKKRIAFYNWKLNVKGPMTPFYVYYTKLLEQYGGQKQLLKLAEEQSGLFVVSYYKAEDLGALSDCIAGNYASAFYEDSKGVYWLRFSPPEDLVILRGKKKEQAKHSGEIGYEVVFIPREMYPKIEPPKLTPAKVTPLNPGTLPDSERNLKPAAPSENGAYYYDQTLANDLQWLAVTVACKGVYDMAYTGDFRAKNPTDYYKTSFIKQYLASNDGRASKGTTLFEGICFDYADFAYQELSANKKNYSPRITKFYMVGTFQDSNDIIAYRIAKSGETSDMKINQTPVVVFSHNHIRAHDGATNHAWFWVQSADGTLYWVDPTWTDNTGRPVYGIVRGGQEMALEPNAAYCVR